MDGIESRMPVSRRTVLKKGALASGALATGGAVMSGGVAAHEGGIALLVAPPGNDTKFHVLSDTDTTYSLTPDCIDDGDYDGYKIQFWRETGSGLTQTGQRWFLVPAGRQLTVTGQLADEDDLEPGDLHELHNMVECTGIGTSPFKFKPMRRANFKKVTPGRGPPPGVPGGPP